MVVRLRLFAQARDAAGTGTDGFEASSLGELLGEARTRYGADFVAVLDRSRVWVNGHEPSRGASTAVHDGDEVAVLPPVSGG